MFRRNRKFYLPKFVHRPGTTVNTTAHGVQATAFVQAGVYVKIAVTYTL